MVIMQSALCKMHKGVAMAKEVSIDADECNGCESCVYVCPDIFRFNESTELAEVIDPDSTDQQCIADAMEVCPVDCIYWK